MDGTKRTGYVWAISAGLNAAFAAIAAKFFSYQAIKYGLVVLFNVTMWGCYVNSLKALSSLQATVTNFAANFLSSGLAGFFLFKETLSVQAIKYGLVVLFNVTMWGCYVNSLKALSSLQATVTNFAANFLSSGLAGFFLFKETLSVQWFAGALLIVIGVVILSKSSIERKERIDQKLD
ncbi:hypothetical protein NC653_014808 [Populus alba x Populus x berolinensis]|uniref:Uncharacterized protein n=1 Tax=Populus alba x Populus x berolinensis TaxID=444605 RepID=A0AAD6QXY5_9ROSI|nr:hypothetical protein NC653_014808 [Populus alba x Populus x berolinensis]